MKELTFYRCAVCGNLICMVNDSGVTPTCCGEEMERVVAHISDSGAEKHLPEICHEGSRILVSVGSIPHPMTDSHYIEWVLLQTNLGTYTRRLQPDTIPEACFRIRSDEHPVRAYALCNLHGLWLRAPGG